MTQIVPSPWHALPHDPLQPLAANLWHCEGDLPGMPLRRHMVVARLKSGDLVIHNAIAMDDANMAALEALGRPAWLVVCNGWHRIDCARYKARYPQLKVVCPKDARKMVERVVAVDGTYDDVPQPGGDDDDTVRFENFGTGRKMEGAMLVRSADGVTGVFGDTLFNLPHRKGMWWFFYGRILGNTGGPRVTTIYRIFMTLGGGKRALRAWMETTAARADLVRLVPGHGGLVLSGAGDTLRAVAATL